MQDNQKYSQDFIDQSWSNMKDLLDKEMPEQKERKRRFVFWWLLPFFLLMITGGVYLMNANDTVTVMPNDEKIPASPTQTIDKEANEKPIAQVDKNAERKAFIPTKKALKFQKNNLINTKIPQVKPQKNQFIQQDLPFENEKNIAETLVKKEVKNTIVIEPQPDEILARNAQVVAKLPIKVPVLLVFQEKEKEMSMRINARKGKWQHTLTLGLRNYYFEKNINPTLEWNALLKGKKWGLRTGLAYAYHSPFFFVNERQLPTPSIPNIINDLGEDLEALPFPVESQSNTESIEYILQKSRVEVNKKTAHYAEMLLALDYNISPKWSTYAGLRSTVLLRYHNEYGLFYNRYNNDLFFMESGTEDYTGRANSEAYFAPNLFNFGAELGVQYSLTARFNVKLKYIQDLSDKYKNIEGKQRGQAIELGVGMKF